MVYNGMLFEVIEWIETGRPTLRPKGKTSSAFQSALVAPNLSMTQVLWEKAWQEEWEVCRALGSLCYENRSVVILRYLLEAGCPSDGLTGYDLCLTHDLELVRLGMRRGVDILEPDGWASAFQRVGSRPLIRLYLEEKDRVPGLKKDALRALCECIEESRLRAIALLRWAGVDPLEKAPRYDDWDEPEEKWTGFPALGISQAEKAREILKLLKLNPTRAQWIDLLEEIVTGRENNIHDVWSLQTAPETVLREEPDRSAKMLRRLLQSLCWGWHWFPERDERLAEFCIRLLELGVPLAWQDKDSIASFRRDVYRSERKAQIFRVLSRASEGASGCLKDDLSELVRTPKMRELVIQHNAMILVNLGLGGPAFYQRGTPTKRSSNRKPPVVSVHNRPSAENQRVSKPSGPESVRVVPVKKTPTPGHTLKRYGSKVLAREQVYADVWASPASHVATQYGISGSMLARICSELNIPRPPRGYWARARSGHKSKKPSLPKWKGDNDGSWAINPSIVQAQRRRRATKA